MIISCHQKIQQKPSIYEVNVNQKKAQQSEKVEKSSGKN